MSQALPEIQRDARVEARDWLVRLQSEDLTSEDITAWETWIGEDEAHQDAYDLAADAWAMGSVVDIRRPTSLELRGDGYAGVTSVAAWNRRRPPMRLAWAASVAAVLVAASAVGWTTWNRLGEEPTQQFGTGLAQHHQVVLSDGSQVQMAAMTNLQVDYDRGRRDIALKSGEALFKVAHNKGRPFVVATARGQITAVGTAFDVHVIGDQLVVSVTEGVVRVAPAGGRSRSFNVAAGQRLTAGDQGVQLVQIGRDTLSSTPWLDGRLEYRNQPLSVVLQDVNRYARSQVVLGDVAAGALDFTGTVQIASIEDWARALPSVFPVAVENVPGKVVVRSKRQESPSAN